MLYYRVKSEYDNTQTISGWTLIKHELLTSSDMKKMCVKREWVSDVNIPKSKTYWSFGARFEIKD